MRSWPDLYLTCEGGTCPVWWGRTLLQSLHWCLECTLRWPPGTTVVYQTRLSYRSDLCGPWCTCSQGGTLHHQDSLSLHSTQQGWYFTPPPGLIVTTQYTTRVVLYTTGTHCHYTVHTTLNTLDNVYVAVVYYKSVSYCESSPSSSYWVYTHTHIHTYSFIN